MNTNYEQNIASAALEKCRHWEQVDGIAGTECPDQWILYSREEGIWTRRSTIPTADVNPQLQSAQDLHKKSEEARRDFETSDKKYAAADKECAAADKECAAADKECAAAKSNLESRRAKTSDYEKAKKKLADSQKKFEIAKKERAKSNKKYGQAKQGSAGACQLVIGFLRKSDNATCQEIDKQSVEEIVDKYKQGGSTPRVLSSSKGDWILVCLGTGVFNQYLVTWDVAAFTSPLRERSLLALDSLMDILFSMPLDSLKTLRSNISSENKTQAKWKQSTKQKLLDLFSELAERIQRIRVATPSSTVADRRRLEQLFPLDRDALEFLREILNRVGIDDDPITDASVKKIDAVKLEATSKSWSESDILKLWRLLPKRAGPDTVREALARVLAEHITKKGDGQADVDAFLTGYQGLMDQNGMDKTAPHPLYYMILSRKSRGALKVLIDACEDELLLGCTAWSVVKGYYQPRVWQALLDGLTDRLTLKFYNNLYDADAFDQVKKIIENVNHMIATEKMPKELQRPYQWRLVSLVREALCHAENAVSDQSIETGGAEEFQRWVKTEFIPNLAFLKTNPQMMGMFKGTEKE